MCAGRHASDPGQCVVVAFLGVFESASSSPNGLDVADQACRGSRFPDVPSINGGLLYTSAPSVRRPQVCAGRHASDPGQCVVVAFLGVFENASSSPKRSGCNPTEPVVVAGFLTCHPSTEASYIQARPLSQGLRCVPADTQATQDNVSLLLSLGSSRAHPRPPNALDVTRPSPVAVGFLTCHPSTEASYIQARPLSRGLKCVSTDMLATFPEDNVSLLLSLGSSRAHPRPPNALDVTRPSLSAVGFLTCRPSTEASYIQARPLSRGLRCVPADMQTTFPEDNVSLLLSLGSSRRIVLDVTRPSLSQPVS